jgi:hypothetical protein
MKELDKLARLRDARLLVAAIQDITPGTTRHDFIRRIQRSYRKFGSLTPAMRETLIASSSRMR